jgi:alkylresorcinol/alkylpyrone synthase
VIVPRIVAVGSALPPAVSQRDVREFAASLFPDLADPRYLAMFDNAAIDCRRLVEPLASYATARPFAEREAGAIAHGVTLGTDAARSALHTAGVSIADVDALVFVSTTAIRSPNLDVDVAATLGLRAEVRRVPVFGLASLGGAAGLGLAADLVRAGYGTVLVVASEINSLMFVPDRATPESLVTLALFSDGAAAAVVRADTDADSVSAGASPAGTVRLVGRHTTLVPDSLHVMGFDMEATGLRWRLVPEVPALAGEHIRPSVLAALGTVGWSLDDVTQVLLHPGGARVLDACRDSLGIDDTMLHASRQTLADHGNVSSVTLLLVLQQFLSDGPVPGRGVATAMGPGFAFEHVLFEVG